MLSSRKTDDVDPVPIDDNDNDIEREIELEDEELGHSELQFDDDSDDEFDGDFLVGRRPGQLPILTDLLTLELFDQGNFFERTVGINLGIRNVSAASIVENGQQTFQMLSNRTYKYMKLQNSYQKTEDKLSGDFKEFDRHTQLKIKQEVGELPSSRSSNVEAFLQYELKVMSRGVQTYMSIPYCQLQFSRFRQRQIVLATIANRIADNKNTLVIIGAPPIRRNCPVRGHLRPPLHKLFHYLKAHPRIWIVVIDEFRTTQLCRQCDHQVTFSNGRHVVYCGRCNMSIDRDKNAAENIRRNGEEFLRTRQIPVAFRRGQQNT